MTFSRGTMFVALGWAALIATASLAAILRLQVVVPDLCLLIVLYLGLVGRGTAPSLVGIALVLGYLQDLFSGSPRGLHALAMGAVMVVARAASSRLLVSSMWQQVLVTFLAALVHGALVLALSAPMYDGEAMQSLRLIPTTALFTAALAPLLFALFRRIDRRLQPDPRALRLGL
jgi:rod shape-determining protein MreD